MGGTENRQESTVCGHVSGGAGCSAAPGGVQGGRESANEVGLPLDECAPPAAVNCYLAAAAAAAAANAVLLARLLRLVLMLLLVVLVVVLL